MALDATIESTKPAKPLLFGQETLSAESLKRLREAGRDYDSSYIPGISERVIENELRVKRGEKPISLPRYRWIRDRSPNGSSVNYAERINETRLGYSPVTLEDIRADGGDMPPAGEVAPDGSIRRMDTILCRVSPEIDAENKREASHRANAARSKTVPDGIAVHEAYEGRDLDEFSRRAGSPQLGENHAELSHRPKE